MKNIKRKNTKKQKGGFFNISGRETKSQRDLIVKCDLTDENSINDPFLMKDKINKCCPSSTFSFFTKNKSIKCNDMKRRYEELLKQNRQHYLKNELNINNINDPRELQKMYLASCPKDRFGFKNGSRLCRELDTRHRQLVLQDNKEIKEDRKFIYNTNRIHNRPTINTNRRLSNFGRNIINMFNNQKSKVEPDKVEPLQNKTFNNQDYNSEFKSNPVKGPVALEQEGPEQKTSSTEIKTGGKKIKRKSKKIIKRRRNIKTRRR